MPMEIALRARMLAAAPVEALAGTRIDWTQRPQGGGYPAVVLTLVSAARGQHMKGFQGLRDARLQIDVYAKNIPDKVALREAVLAAIAGPFTQGGVRFERVADVTIRGLGGDADGGFIHRDSIDLTIWFTEET